MGSVDEETLWKHWMYLKNELHVEDLLVDLVKSGVFTEHQQNDILHVSPNTRQMKAEKFLKVLIQSGEKGFDVFCEILRRNSDNRYQAVIDKLNISNTPVESTGASGIAAPINNNVQFRPESSASAASSTSLCSLPSHDGETGEKNIKQNKSARRAWRSDASMTGSETARQPMATQNQENLDVSTVTQNTNRVVNNDEPQGAASISGQLNDRQNSNIDMQVLEQELLRLAPTIADVFHRISQSTAQVPVSEEDIKKVREDNERLRKTNRTLIEKLNIFQQRIIRLQLENKNLREEGEGANEAKKDLEDKANELDAIEKRIENQKIALEEKEKELKVQLMKIEEIENNMSKQRNKIQELHTLYDEGVEESCKQQDEIQKLQEEKEVQDAQIGQLEYKQKLSNERMKDLEDRLEQLEIGGRNRRGIGLRRSNPRAATKRMLGMMSDYN
ncbi:girdin-like isoform X6 [Mytilus californianus]|uniref:girdin-like isoform X6 n=1 Tax=Mytilus californianus TaxID=6549 RepID=UPI00224844CF|nr:girdin-like isoform X6 [Mytilus californianus]